MTSIALEYHCNYVLLLKHFKNEHLFVSARRFTKILHFRFAIPRRDLKCDSKTARDSKVTDFVRSVVEAEGSSPMWRRRERTKSCHVSSNIKVTADCKEMLFKS